MEVDARQSQQQWRERADKRREERRLLVARIDEDLFEPRREMLANKKYFMAGFGFDSQWKLALTAVGSRSPQADVFDILFDASGSGVNHIVRVVDGWEVHLIRWGSEPNRMLNHIFEIFAQAGARLDLVKRQLIVAKERTLFPDAFRSLAFCGLAAGVLSAGRDELYRFEFWPSDVRHLVP
jgi:hypothetical protein